MLQLIGQRDFFPDAGQQFGQALVELPRNQFLYSAILVSYVVSAYFITGAAMAAGAFGAMLVGFTLSKMAFTDRNIEMLQPFRSETPSASLFFWVSVLANIFYKPLAIAADLGYYALQGRHIYQLSQGHV